MLGLGLRWDADETQQMLLGHHADITGVKKMEGMAKMSGENSISDLSGTGREASVCSGSRDSEWEL